MSQPFLPTYSGTRLRKFTIPKDSTYSSAKCMFFDVRLLHADEDACAFIQSTSFLVRLGLPCWIHNLVEIGAGAGAIWFTAGLPRQQVNGYTGITADCDLSSNSLQTPPGRYQTWIDIRVGICSGLLRINHHCSIEADFSKPRSVFSLPSQRVESNGFHHPICLRCSAVDVEPSLQWEIAMQLAINSCGGEISARFPDVSAPGPAHKRPWLLHFFPTFAAVRLVPSARTGNPPDRRARGSRR